MLLRHPVERKHKRIEAGASPCLIGASLFWPVTLTGSRPFGSRAAPR
jgi:hypothetical protein